MTRVALFNEEKGALLVLIGNVAGALLAFGTQVVIARLFGGAVYGVYSLAVSWTSFMATVCLFGTEVTSLRYINAYRAMDDRDRLSAYLRWSTVWPLAVAAVLSLPLVVGARVTPSVGDWLARVGGLSVIALLLVTVAVRAGAAHLQAVGRAAQSQFLQSPIRAVLFLVIVLALSAWGRSIVAANHLIVGSALSGVVVAILLNRGLQAACGDCVKRGRAPDGARQEWLRVSAALAVVGLAQALLASSSILILGEMVNAAMVAQYVAASQFTLIIGMIVGALNSVVAPQIARLWAEGRFEALTALVRRSNTRVFVLSVAIAVSLWGGAPWMLGAFGPEYVDAAWVLRILLIGQCVMASEYASGFLLTVTGQERLAAGIIGVSAAVSVIGAILLIPFLGMLGAAIATSAAVALRALVLGRIAARTLASASA